MNRFLLFCLLIGCSDDVYCPIPDEQMAMLAAADAWYDFDLSLDGCSLSNVQVYEAQSYNEFVILCQAQPVHSCTGQGRCAGACFLHNQPNPSYPAGPVIVIADGLTHTELVDGIAHETIHVLGECSGLGQDLNHEDQRRWGKVGALKQAWEFMRAIGV